jgi:hypothetical protein
MNSVRLHRQLVQSLATIGVGASQPQRTNLAGLTQALAFSANCHLATLALGLPFAGQRENLIQRLRRFLKHADLHPLAFYGPLVRHLLDHWPAQEVTLVMDRTDLANRLSILTLGAAYHKRLLPLAWEVSAFGGSSAARQMALLKWVQPYLPPLTQVRINFYGDAEFRGVDCKRAAAPSTGTGRSDSNQTCTFTSAMTSGNRCGTWGSSAATAAIAKGSI